MQKFWTKIDMENKNKKNERTVILNITGACGNQFFQYAFARMIQESTNSKLVINYKYVCNMDGLWEGSDNLLSHFNTTDYTYTIDDKFNSKLFILKVIGKLRQIFHLYELQKKSFLFIDFLSRWLPYIGIYYYGSAYKNFPISNCRTIIVQGYFESPKYFHKIDGIIKKELTPKHPLLDKNQFLYDKITETESVCITIKRQDIENKNISDIYTYDISYFYTGIKYIKKQVTNPVFFVFSDNIEWCRKNLTLEGEYYFETDRNPVWEKIRLMSACKHFIIHNSTFSWWAQHLSPNKDKIVLAPVKWLQRDDQPIDIYEDNWLYITPDGKITDKHE